MTRWEDAFAIGKLRSLLDVLDFNAERFCALCYHIAEVRTFAAVASSGAHEQATVDEILPHVFEGVAREHIRKGIEDARTIQLQITEKALQRLLAHCDGKNVIHAIDLASRIEEIYRVFCDELAQLKFYCVSEEDVRQFLEPSPPFGDDAELAFPKASEDIVEAANCIAMARYTSSIFHLMRAMECAVQSLSTTLGIVNIDREWGKLLSDMKEKIEAKPRGHDRDQWSEAHSLLYHVKQAWRNDVMHPKQTYTEEQAKEVFVAVRSFMRHLAFLVE